MKRIKMMKMIVGLDKHMKFIIEEYIERQNQHPAGQA